MEKWQQKYVADVNQHIIMISEGSCDTEDWSNDAGNPDLITGEICTVFFQRVLSRNNVMERSECWPLLCWSTCQTMWPLLEEHHAQPAAVIGVNIMFSGLFHTYHSSVTTDASWQHNLKCFHLHGIHQYTAVKTHGVVCCSKDEINAITYQKSLSCHRLFKFLLLLLILGLGFPPIPRL